MKCVLIVSPGEKSEGASELHRMGYELELYPSTADLSPLRDAREEESASYLGRSPASGGTFARPFSEGIFHTSSGGQKLCWE